MKNRMETGRLHALSFCALALMLFCHCASPASAANGTKLRNLRAGLHSGYTRLVFDADGERPSAIGPATDSEFTIRFGQLDLGALAGKKFSYATGAVAEVTFRQADSGSEAIISLREGHAAVKKELLGGDRKQGGGYRLVLDFYPGHPKGDEPGGTPREPGPTSKKNQPGQGKEVESLTSLLQPSPAAQEPEKNGRNADAKGKQPKDPKDKQSKKAQAEKSKRKGNVQSPAPPPFVKEPPVPDTESTAKLYDDADAYFSEHENTVSQDAPEIIARYSAALSAGPKSARAPLAMYRCGLSYFEVLNFNKAERVFRDFVERWPDDPLTGRCWVKLGTIYSQKGSELEAVDAFRSALRTPMDKADKGAAYFRLGKSLTGVGAYKDAQEMLNQSMNEDPFTYVKNPEVFRYLGETSFALQQYDASRGYLLRYMNIQDACTDRDVVLAKIAEIFLRQGDQPLANRLYNYIQTHYPDTEGDMACKIRKAELMEKKKGGAEGAMAIYQEIARKNPPATLRNLVNYRLASAEYSRGNYEKCLNLLAVTLQGKPDSESYANIVALRDKALTDWLKRAYATKDYSQVVQLYQKNLPIYKSMHSPEIETAAAESFAELKLYPNALEIYEALCAGAKKKNDDWLMKAAQFAYLIGDYEKAAQYCKQVQAGSYENAKGQILASIFAKQGKYADAVKNFAKVFKSDADYATAAFDAVYSYMKCLVELKKYDEALALLQKGADPIGKADKEDRVKTLLLASKCQKELNQPDQAIQSLESALQLTGIEEQSNLLNYEISNLYLAQGQPEKAAEKLKLILQSSQSFWKTAAQQQLDSITMARPPQPEPAAAAAGATAKQ